MIIKRLIMNLILFVFLLGFFSVCYSVEQIQSIVYGSGIPLGGLGAGNVEIRADGGFHEWFLFPIAPWTQTGHRAFKRIQFPAPFSPEDAVFALWTSTEGEKPALTMLRTPRFEDEFMAERLYFMPGLRYVPKIKYNGEFPFAYLEYIDAELPVQVSLKAFSPFILHDSQNSGLPVAIFRFTVKNKTDKPVIASLLANFLNPVGYGLGEDDASKSNSDIANSSSCCESSCKQLDKKGETQTTALRINYNHLVSDSSYTAIGMFAANIPKNVSSYGNMTLAAFGGNDVQTSYLSSWQRKKWDYPRFWNDFSKNGTLPNLDGSKNPPDPNKIFLSLMSPEQKEAFFDDWLKDPVIQRYYQFLLKDESGAVKRGEDLRELIFRQMLPIPQRVFGALAQKTKLSPGEEREITFILAWYFPNLPYSIVHDPSQDYVDIPEMNGRMYTNWFDNSKEVMDYVTSNFSDLYKRTTAQHNAIYNTTLDKWLIDVINTQTTTMSKTSIWSASNEFSLWDGMGCCGTYAAGDTPNQAAMIRPLFFPDLASRGALGKFGYVNLNLNSGFFERQDNRYWLPVRVYYDYKWLGNREILEKNWKYVADALEFGLALDKDHDGLPECSYLDQMYDQWPRYGTNAYVGSLWLCYLQSASKIAEILGYTDFTAKCQNLLKKGQNSFDKTLWNGQYYRLYQDLETGNRDEGCEISQVHGQWLADLYGIGDILPDHKVRSVLKAIYQYNRHASVISGQSVRCGSWPLGGEPEFGLRCWQWGTAWSRSEFALASHMLYRDMIPEAIQVMRDVYERHKKVGMDFNHVECGSHYSGALDSWCVHLALLGFQLDAANKKLQLFPKVKENDFKAFLPLNTGWGQFIQKRKPFEQKNTIKIIEGNADLSTLVLELPDWRSLKYFKINVSNNGKPVNFTYKHGQNKIEINFPGTVNIISGQQLEILTNWSE